MTVSSLYSAHHPGRRQSGGLGIDYLPWNRPVMLADRACVRDTQVELTYAEVARRVDAVAGQFAAAGVVRGTWSR